MENERKPRQQANPKKDTSRFIVSLSDASKSAKVELPADDLTHHRSITAQILKDRFKAELADVPSKAAALLRIFENQTAVTIEKVASYGKVEYKYGKESIYQQMNLGETLLMPSEMYLTIGGKEYLLTKVTKWVPPTPPNKIHPLAVKPNSLTAKQTEKEYSPGSQSPTRIADLLDSILKERENKKEEEEESSDLSSEQPSAAKPTVVKKNPTPPRKKGDVWEYARVLTSGLKGFVPSTPLKEQIAIEPRVGSSLAKTSPKKSFSDLLAEFGRQQQQKHARRDEENAQRLLDPAPLAPIDSIEMEVKPPTEPAEEAKKNGLPQKEHLYHTFRKVENIKPSDDKPVSDKHYIRLKKNPLVKPEPKHCRDCPICLSQIEEELGRLSCNHYFCFDCVFDWSEVTNVCPLCKREFRYIQKLDRVTEVVLKTTKVARKRQTFDDDIEWIIDENCDESCYECRRGDDETRLLVCDWCSWYCCHLYCLDPPLTEVPQGQWYCKYCLNEDEERQTTRSRRSRSRNQSRRRRRAIIEEQERDASLERERPLGGGGRVVSAVTTPNKEEVSTPLPPAHFPFEYPRQGNTSSPVALPRESNGGNRLFDSFVFRGNR